MKKYMIIFEYEAVRGRNMKSTVYADTEEEAYTVITKHLKDEQTPLAAKWNLYKLIDGGEK